ncbi:hypothetical protein Mal4_24740 [Maioricimonas rarisocia]|uniref:DUF368 domain-containing protein n=1 Tax=Maioricimonas rarisocia TaxID=2528026 RepID=A0A517Z6V3_9PLAN|nr:DUF368 domain-containing protein [Maioricimonas rarisocia]QDU38151.1 hypothetical protein Mal4_24740 [Maioricimonas rarisocia]
MTGTTDSAERTDEATGFRIAGSDLAQTARGLLMGGADIIPGVSGGTVALILGIYERLVTSISHFDTTLVRQLGRKEWKAAAERINFRFLAFLGLGIGLGVAALGSLMHGLLEHYYQFTMAAFFGLIAASALLVARMVERWNAAAVVAIVLGALFAFWLVRQPALQQPPEGLGYVFICGMVAICAMILPGISGSFILLIMGKYHDITGIIKETLKLHITLESISTVAVFGAGCVLGLIGFSKCLRWLLARHESLTMSVLCGFMAGSLWKIWPFQRDVSPEGVTEFKHRVYEHIPLLDVPIDGRFWLTIAIAVVAGGLVLALDYFTAGHEHVPPLKEEEEEPVATQV